MRLKLAKVYEGSRQAFKSYGNVINVVMRRQDHHKRDPNLPMYWSNRCKMERALITMVSTVYTA